MICLEFLGIYIHYIHVNDCGPFSRHDSDLGEGGGTAVAAGLCDGCSGGGGRPKKSSHLTWARPINSDSDHRAHGLRRKDRKQGARKTRRGWEPSSLAASHADSDDRESVSLCRDQMKWFCAQHVRRRTIQPVQCRESLHFFNFFFFLTQMVRSFETMRVLVIPKLLWRVAAHGLPDNALTHTLRQKALGALAQLLSNSFRACPLVCHCFQLHIHLPMPRHRRKSTKLAQFTRYGGCGPVPEGGEVPAEITQSGQPAISLFKITRDTPVRRPSLITVGFSKRQIPNLYTPVGGRSILKIPHLNKKKKVRISTGIAHFHLLASLSVYLHAYLPVCIHIYIHVLLSCMHTFWNFYPKVVIFFLNFQNLNK